MLLAFGVKNIFCVQKHKKMSASAQKSSPSSESVISDYMSPIKIFGHAKSEIGEIFSEINDCIDDSVSLLSGLFLYFCLCDCTYCCE